MCNIFRQQSSPACPSLSVGIAIPYRIRLPAVCIVCADILPHILLHSLDILQVLNNGGANIDGEVDIVVVAFRDIARISRVLIVLLALLKWPSNDGI